MYEFSIPHLKVTFSMSREKLAQYQRTVYADILDAKVVTLGEAGDLCMEADAYQQVLLYGVPSGN